MTDTILIMKQWQTSGTPYNSMSTKTEQYADVPNMCQTLVRSTIPPFEKPHAVQGTSTPWPH